MVNKTLLLEQIKRFWAIPALATLAFVLAVYLPLHAAGDNYWAAMNMMVNIITMRDSFMMFITVVTPVIVAFCTFGCFFNKQAVTNFYSLPMNKSQLFATNALAGIILSLIPVFIFCALMFIPFNFGTISDSRFVSVTEDWTFNWDTVVGHRVPVPMGAIPSGVMDGFVINTPAVVASFFLRMVIVTLFYFGVAWLAFSLAGNGIIALLIVAVMPFVPWVLVELSRITAFAYVFGYHADASNFSRLFMAYHNPAAWGSIIRPDVLNHTQAVIIPALIYLVLGAIIYAGAYFVSRARKPERTGNSVMFAPVKNVLIFMVSLLAMIILGIVFFAMFESFAMLHVGFALGFVIGNIVAQMIAEKSFYIASKIKYVPVFSGVAAAVYIFVLVFTQFGMGFYVNRVPAQDEIYAVYVTNQFIFGGLTNEEWRIISNTDPEFIAAARVAHQTVLDGRDYLHSIPNLNQGGRYRRYVNGVFQTRDPFFIKYTLRNGQTVRRMYSLPGTFVKDSSIGDFFSSEGVVLARYPVFQNPEALAAIALSISHQVFDEEFGRVVSMDGGRVLITNRAQMDEVMEILAQSAVELAMRERATTEARLRGEFEHVQESARETARSFTLEPGPPRISVAFQIQEEGFGSRIPMWRNPHVSEDSAIRLMELVEEWGLLEEAGLVVRHISEEERLAREDRMMWEEQRALEQGLPSPQQLIPVPAP